MEKLSSFEDTAHLIRNLTNLRLNEFKSSSISRLKAKINYNNSNKKTNKENKMNTYEIGNIITAKFASLNKNETLELYKEECSKEQFTKRDYKSHPADDMITTNWTMEKCKIEQYFEVTQKEWNNITEDFFSENILYRKKGGTIYTGTSEDFDYDILHKDKDMLEDYKRNNARLVTIIKLEDSKKAIAIDPQGYSYARYVGII